MAIIEIDHVSKAYEVEGEESTDALKDVSIDIKEGEFVCIVGPSGCGKSTLLEIVAGLLNQTGGEVRVDGKPVKGTSREIGVVFQDAALYPWRTIRRNIGLGLELSKAPKEKQKEQVEKYMELTGLSDFADKYPSQLSGGMKQRAGIARALVMDPRVILMDEPFSALDYLTRCKLQEELMAIREKEKKTILFVTHDINEAVYLADRVILLSPRPSVVQKEYVIKNSSATRDRRDSTLMKIAAEISADISRGASTDEYIEYII